MSQKRTYHQPGVLNDDISLLRTIVHTPSLFLLLALVIQILVSPYEQAELIETITQLTVVGAALWVSADVKRHLVVGLVLAIPGTLLLIIARALEMEFPSWLAYGFYLLLYIHIIRLMLRQVFLAKVVTIGTIGTAMCIYVMLGSLFMLFYIPLAALDANAFNVSQATEGGNMISTLNYFSFVTLTTLGYGDIQPISPIARSIAVIEALTGVLFLAVLISRLVGTFKANQDLEEELTRDMD